MKNTEEIDDEKEDRAPPHHWFDKRTGEVYRWGGLATCFCTNCHLCFTSEDAFERHFIMDQTDDGDGMMCYDPSELQTRSGEPAFEWVEKLSWTTGGVWMRYSASRGTHPQAAKR